MPRLVCLAQWVPIVRAITEIKVAITSYYPQYFAVIARNTKQHCDFGVKLPPKNWTLPLGVIYPQFGNHWFSPMFSNRDAIYNTQE